MPIRFLLAPLPLLALIGAAAGILPVLAQPQIPSSFYGSVTVDGQPAPDSTEVRGLIEGIDCTQADPGSNLAARQGAATIYVLHVVHESQRPGCGRDGRTVTFTIAGVPAAQQALWRPGPQQVDLSSGSGSPIPLPTAATAQPSPTATTPVASSPTLQRPTGVPPTDDVQFPPATGQASTAVTPPSTASDSAGGPSAWWLFASAIGVIAALGAAAGVVFARRRQAGLRRP